MKCSLGMLCGPMRSLGLHSHRSTATKRSRKRIVRKTSSRRKRR